jgi:beta-glucosidase
MPCSFSVPDHPPKAAPRHATDGALVPEGFRFGVATAGFQIEGGFNGPGEPRNNWYGWESSGRVEPSGAAVHFWDDPDALLDRARALGCDSFRLSVEWARVVPVEGVVDDEAVAGYRRILTSCHDRGLEPLVTLHHFTHPAWAGEDFWLRPDAPERFTEWVRVAVGLFGDLCGHWVSINEANVLAIETWLVGSLPPGRIGALGETVLALDHLTAAHVLAYDAIHAVQPDAVVATNNIALSLYDVDRLPLDLLVARHEGIALSGLGPFLDGRRRSFYDEVRLPRRWAPRLAETALRTLARRAVSPRSDGTAVLPLPRTVAAVYDSPHDRLLDVAQLDYYAPGAAAHFQLPGTPTAGGRWWEPGRPLWDDPPDPAGLAAYSARAAVAGLDVWIVENGMCNRVRRGRSYPRRDGWDRPRYLRENLAAVVIAVESGVPVTGYWHWTLVDNYEWGSYEPRFGLHGVDRERGLSITDTDAMGRDAAGAYRDLIAAIRRGDRSALSPGDSSGAASHDAG